MGIPAINSLANMEYMLYGGNSGLNMNCPSYLNGYVGGRMNNYANMYGNYFNPAFKGYPNQDIFTLQNGVTGAGVNQNIIDQAAQGNSQANLSNPQFKGLSDDLNELGDYYIKNSAPSESFMGAAIGGAAFGLMNNPRIIVHPWNSFTSTKAVSEMFKGIKDEKTAIGKLWRDEAKGGYEIVSNAYSRMHKLESLMQSKLGLFRRSLSKLPKGEAEYKRIKAGMESAIKTGNIKELALWTEEAKRITNAMTGYIPRFMKWAHIEKPFVAIRKFINPTHYEADIANVAKKAITEAGEKTTFTQFMKHSCGFGNGLLFAGFEFFSDKDKLKAAFSKDSITGWTQFGQTAIKGAGSAIGWGVGEGIGAWAGAKLGMIAGAKLGTVISPGIGTAIGAVAGLIGGSIGCWLTGKITHKLVGQDVGTKVEVENMKKTKDGQYQLLTLTAQQANEDKNISPRTVQALQNVAAFYGAA